jgi:hypothetical protein
MNKDDKIRLFRATSTESYLLPSPTRRAGTLENPPRKRKPMDEEKFRALLAKLRKGAYASLSTPQLVEVIERIGGFKVEEIVVLVPDGSGKYPKVFAGENKGALEAQWQQARADLVSELPAVPVLGRRYTMEVTDIEPSEGYGKGWWDFRARAWEGRAALRFTADNGSSFVQVESGHSKARDPWQLSVGMAMNWLMRETDYMQRVNAYLGTEQHVPAAQRTREHTGTCCGCWRNIKLDDRGNMVLHGYRRRGIGFVEGDCSGYGWPPYETSSRGLVHVRTSLVNGIDRLRAYVERLRSGEIVEVRHAHGGKPYRKDELSSDRWSNIVDNEAKDAQRDIASLEAELGFYDYAIRTWHEYPLPREGDADPAHFARLSRERAKLEGKR